MCNNSYLSNFKKYGVEYGIVNKEGKMIKFYMYAIEIYIYLNFN